MSWWSKLFGRAQPVETGPAPLHFPQVPAFHEVVFEELIVRVFVHNIFQGAHSIPCWSYVTDGMRRYGQKEFVFTLKRRDDEAIEDYPRDPLRLFTDIFSVAVRGKKVEVNQFTQYRPPDGFLERNNIVAVAYTPSEKIPGVNYPECPLAAILLIEEEATLLDNIGTYRVLTRLGHINSYFPTAPWSDRDRKPVLTSKELATSILGKMPTVDARWATVQLRLDDDHPPTKSGTPGDKSAALSNDRLQLRVQSIASMQIRESFSHIPADASFAWVMPPSEDANARLVWQPGMDHVEALLPPGSPGDVQTGGFLAFAIADDQPEGGQIIEDGFYLSLHRASMVKLRDALIRCERMDIGSGEERLRFSLSWEYPERKGSALEFGNGLLYQTEETLQDRIVDRQAFEHYVSSLKTVLQQFVENLPQAQGQNLLFVAAIRPGLQTRFWLDVLPDGFPVEWKEELESRLKFVRVPAVQNGPVAYAMFGKLWGGASVMTSQTQMVPEEWRKAAMKLSNQGTQDTLDTDDILRHVWPE